MARYEEIELNGEKFPIMFSMKVILQFCRANNLKLDEFTNQIQSLITDDVLLESLVWFGFKNGHELSKKEFTIEKNMVLQVDVNTYSKYIELISDSIVGDGGNPQGAETAKANKGKKLKAVKA
jgi:hypothetical protein